MTLITSIQKYSVHDGDGIRTTIFFKGCPLSCTWCHNPETQNYNQEIYYNQESCTHCGLCYQACNHGAIKIIDQKVVLDHSKCQLCGMCIDVCPNNLREIMGVNYEIDYLVKEAMKDEMFYEESGGGVTLSGGEVMSVSIDYLEKLLKALTKKGLSVNIDTSGFAKEDSFDTVLPYVDTFLFDVKVINQDKHLKYMGMNNELILANLKRISDKKARINIRIPLIKEINANREDIQDIIDFLKDNHIKVKQINLLPYHNIGAHKYQKLGLEYQGDEYSAPSDDEMEEFKEMFNQAGFTSIKIGG